MRPSVDHLTVDHFTTESRRWRTRLLVACALAIAVGLWVSFQCTPLEPYCGTAGLDADFHPATASVEITGIAKGGPAALAGLRVGDRINYRDIAFRERWRLRAIRNAWPFPAGEQLRLIVQRGTQHFATVVIPQRMPPSWGTWSVWLLNAIQLWGLVFAALLAIRRPDLVLARLLSLLLIVMFGFINLTSSFVPWTIADFVTVVTGGSIFQSVPIALIAIISAQFARPLSLGRRLLTAAAVALSAIVAACSLARVLTWYVLALPISQVATIFSYVQGLGSALALICAIVAVVASRGAQRQQAAWIAAAIAPFFLLIAIASPFDFTRQHLFNEINQVAEYALLIVPVGLTYAVLSRRCVDMGYAINRAAVFTGMSIVVLAVFVVVEWALSALVSNASHTTSLVVNIGVALILGLSLRFIHKRVEYVIDRVLFRKRHENEVALQRFTREAAFITDEHTLLERTEKMVAEHGEASAVSVLLKDGNAGYIAHGGNGAPPPVDENDPAIVAMRTWREPLDLQRYETVLEGSFAFPMIARGNLVGVLVCAGKRNGEAYAPDESETIAQLAQGVGAALDLLAHKSENSPDVILDAIRSSNGSLLDAIKTLSTAIERRDAANGR